MQPVAKIFFRGRGVPIFRSLSKCVFCNFSCEDETFNELTSRVSSGKETLPVLGVNLDLVESIEFIPEGEDMNNRR